MPPTSGLKGSSLKSGLMFVFYDCLSPKDSAVAVGNKFGITFILEAVLSLTKPVGGLSAVLFISLKVSPF